jgi:hypothetical protein
MCHGANGTNEKTIYMHVQPHTTKIKTAAATLQNTADKNTAATERLL